MHVGQATIFQNPDQARTDREVWRDDLKLALLAEPLGFESVWGVEHHFTDYTMCPDVLQYLTFLAGATERIQLGSMVVVLPWHNPIRVAEQISVLDHVSNGRFILGLGRGLGRVEFEGFGVDMTESRDRFAESAEMILTGLETGYLRVRRQVHQAGAPRHPAEAVEELQRSQLRRGRLARVGSAGLEARPRHADHPAEAVGRGQRRSARLQRDMARA